MSTYSEYFLKTSSSVIEYELLEVSHPNFTQTYRVVLNSIYGVTVTLETGQVRTFQYRPLKISYKGGKDHLDVGLNVQLGDLGEILPKEVDAVDAADGWDIYPTALYRTYRSDNLAAPLLGPHEFEVISFAFTEEGAQFECKAPRLNMNRTGLIYNLDDIPMLRGFL